MCGAGAYHVSPPFAAAPSWGCASVPCRSHKLVSKGALCARTGNKSTGLRGTRLSIVGSHTRHNSIGAPSRRKTRLAWERPSHRRSTPHRLNPTSRPPGPSVCAAAWHPATALAQYMVQDGMRTAASRIRPLPTSQWKAASCPAAPARSIHSPEPTKQLQGNLSRKDFVLIRGSICQVSGELFINRIYLTLSACRAY